MNEMDRRRFLESAGSLTAVPLLGMDDSPDTITKPIPSSGESIPVIGMGTWLTFDAGRGSSDRTRLRGVLQTFFDRGGRLIDSSPMYGRSELVVGELLPQINPRPALFSATKVWTPGRRFGVMQMEASQKLWRVPRFDLLQVHNLLDWEGHLQTLKEWKASGRVRYIGVTTSTAGGTRSSSESCCASRSTSCSSPITSRTARPRVACCRSHASAKWR